MARALVWTAAVVRPTARSKKLLARTAEIGSLGHSLGQSGAPVEICLH